MTKPINRILSGLKDHLLDLKEQGIDAVEADPELVKKLGMMTAAIPKVEKRTETTRVPRTEMTGRTLAPLTGPAAKLKEIADEIAVCKNCRLAFKRTNTVPGQGNPQPEVMFVGEGPGEDEDLQGLAFVGRAGQLLTKMIEAMGLTRDEVFIGNIVKCRPPDNRKPEPDEMESCIPFLKRQIAVIKPKVIVALGGTAVQGLVGMPEGIGITKIRGQWKTYEGIDLMQSLHPSYLLRNPSAKKDAWEDLKAVLRKIGRPVPGR